MWNRDSPDSYNNVIYKFEILQNIIYSETALTFYSEGIGGQLTS